MGGVSYAVSEINLADHMIYVTLPLLDDKRVFINAVNHMGNAFRFVIKAFFEREYRFKRVNFLPPDDLVTGEFLNRYINKLGLSVYFDMVKNVNCFNDVRAKSSIKLKRNDQFIIISPEYSMTALSIPQVKDYLRLGKEFVAKMGDFLK